MWDDPDVRACLGGKAPPVEKPSEFFLIAGIRTAKSMISAAAALKDALTCDLEGLAPGEIPRVSVLSYRKDLAVVTFNHLTGAMMASDVLRPLVVGAPGVDSIMIRHPTGRLVEIKVVAGARAGSTLVARWCAGCIFDEAPRMVSGDEGIINLDEALHAVRGRIRPGAGIMFIGSPWAPYGLVYDTVQKVHGKPSNHQVVFWGTGPRLNPFWWTDERAAALEEKDPQAYRTDVLGQFVDPEESVFSTDLIDEMSRHHPLERDWEENHHYEAACDPATRGNAWTFAIGTCTGENESGLPMWEVVLYREWQGTPKRPLRPREVIREMAELCAQYNIAVISSDQYAADWMKEMAEDFGVVVSSLWKNNTSKYKMGREVEGALKQRRLILPAIPELKRDFQNIKRRVTANGPKYVEMTTNDGRHCDGWSAICLLFGDHPPELPDVVVEREHRPFRDAWEKKQAENPWDALARRFTRDPELGDLEDLLR